MCTLVKFQSYVVLNLYDHSMLIMLFESSFGKIFLSRYRKLFSMTLVYAISMQRSQERALQKLLKTVIELSFLLDSLTNYLFSQKVLLVVLQ